MPEEGELPPGPRGERQGKGGGETPRGQRWIAWYYRRARGGRRGKVVYVGSFRFRLAARRAWQRARAADPHCR